MKTGLASPGGQKYEPLRGNARSVEIPVSGLRISSLPPTNRPRKLCLADPPHLIDFRPRLTEVLARGYRFNRGRRDGA